MREHQKTSFARRLRREMTDAEREIWHHLRNRALMGCKFRRQHPIGPYVADFVCIERKLVVELDGSQHVGCSKDADRTRSIESMGYHMLRFWNNDVFEQQDTVLSVIFDVLKSRALTPTPLPRAGEGLFAGLPSRAGEGLFTSPSPACGRRCPKGG